MLYLRLSFGLLLSIAYHTAGVEFDPRDKNFEGSIQWEGSTTDLLVQETTSEHRVTSKAQLNASTRKLTGVESDPSNGQCDYSVGKWVPDSAGPLYQICPYIRPQWVCRSTNRPSFSYENWRWQPLGCDLPSFNSSDLLHRLRNRSIAFMGDSLGGQQFASMVCLIASGTSQPPEDVGVEFGHSEVKRIDYKNFNRAYRFHETNTTIIFIWSFVLCELEDMGKSVAVHLDKPDPDLITLVRDADVIVLNTGHHWNRVKAKQNKWQMLFHGERAKKKPTGKLLGLKEARKLAEVSIIQWLDQQLENMPAGRRPLVVLRTISTAHFMGGGFNSGGRCDHLQEIFTNKQVKGRKAEDKYAEAALNHTTNVELLNITYMSLFRGEAHPSMWTSKLKRKIQDCLHWCLPGVPDTWNEVLSAYIKKKFT